jgi:hypothetical protein
MPGFVASNGLEIPEARDADFFKSEQRIIVVSHYGWLQLEMVPGVHKDGMSGYDMYECLSPRPSLPEAPS